jgi:hypothetical protein
VELLTPPPFAVSYVPFPAGWYVIELVVAGVISCVAIGGDERTEGLWCGWDGFGPRGGGGARCGARRTFDLAALAIAELARRSLRSIRARPSSNIRETPPLKTAAMLTLDAAAGCRVPRWPAKLETSEMAPSAATASPTAATAAAGQWPARTSSSRRPLWAAAAPAGVVAPAAGSAGASSASWNAADRSPQKSSALGGAASRSRDDVRGPKGTRSSRGPIQSLGRRTTLLPVWARPSPSV